MNAKNESLLDYVLRRLRETKGHWNTLANVSGVPYSTICKIAQGVIDNPSVRTTQALADTLRTYEALGTRAGKQIA